MIDLIVASRKFDFGYVYDGWKGVSFLTEDIIRDGKGQNILASTYKRRKNIATRNYKNILEKFGVTNINFE